MELNSWNIYLVDCADLKKCMEPCKEILMGAKLKNVGYRIV